MCSGQKLFDDLMAKMLPVSSPCLISSMYYSLRERKGVNSTTVFKHIRTSRAVYVLVLCGMSVRYRVEQIYYLALIVDIGSCLQQSLDCLGVSLISSCLQRNIAILYESMRDKRTVIASGDYCCRTERREREKAAS